MNRFFWPALFTLSLFEIAAFARPAPDCNTINVIVTPLFEDKPSTQVQIPLCYDGAQFTEVPTTSGEYWASGNTLRFVTKNSGFSATWITESKKRVYVTNSYSGWRLQARAPLAMHLSKIIAAEAKDLKLPIEKVQLQKFESDIIYVGSKQNFVYYFVEPEYYPRSSSQQLSTTGLGYDSLGREYDVTVWFNSIEKN